jgi:hypothetical protein
MIPMSSDQIHAVERSTNTRTTASTPVMSQ